MHAEILLMSDDLEARGIWAQSLKQKGLEVVMTRSTKETLDLCTKQAFDLVVVDIYTPHLDEIDFCRQLRAQVTNPILLFTYSNAEPQLLEAYRVGVDECIPKPVCPPLFLAKVMAWLRRAWTMPLRTLGNLCVGGLSLETARRQVIHQTGRTIKLSGLEFKVLYFLMSHPGQVLDSNTIIDWVWGYVDYDDHSLLINVIYRLRRKLEPNPHFPHYILTVAGEGYFFQPD